MKIVHIATLISADGAYGGPVRVATNITREMASRHHEAELWGGSRGYARDTRILDGVRVRLFRARLVVPSWGFATTVAPGLIWALLTGRSRPDLLHIHLARDFVTLPAALLARLMGIPYVVQTHGMIVRKPSAFARAFDLFLTRPALRGAAQVLYLTNYEHEQLQLVDTLLERFTRLVNGIPVDGEVLLSHDSDECEVLFLARMHARKRPMEFTKAASELLSRGHSARFFLVGPDEGEGADINREIDSAFLRDRVVYEGALPPELTNMRIARCDVYVLPSVNEPFPMSVIEAMSLGKPVVITDTCGLASYVSSARAGVVVGSNRAELVEAIDRLIGDPEERRAMGARGRDLVEREFGIAAVGDRLSQVYGEALEWAGRV